MDPEATVASDARGWSRLPLGVLAAAAAHGSRMLVNLVIIKMIAVAIGPAGLGALGNLISLLSVVMVFAGGGIANGITKYVAQFRSSTRSMLRLIETAFSLGLCVSAFILVASIVWARPLAQALFADPLLWWLSPLLGLAHLACFAGTAVIAVANGNNRPDIFAAVSLTAYAICVPVAYALIAAFGFAGAAMAMMCMAGFTGLPAVWIMARSRLRRVVRLRFHRAEVGMLGRFSAMTLVSAVTFPIAETLIRAAAIDRLGMSDAGIWQAGIRLSGAIMGFYTVYLATSYMPRLSAMSDPAMAARLVRVWLFRTGGVFLAIAIGIYALRSLIVPLLFSEEFSPLEPLLAWQLLGDLLRVMAYVIGFLVIARARLSLHIGAELLQYSLFVGISLAILHTGGDLSDLAKGYAVSFGVYLALGIVWLQVWGRKLA